MLKIDQTESDRIGLNRYAVFSATNSALPNKQYLAHIIFLYYRYFFISID